MWKNYCFVCGREMFTVVKSRHGLGSWEEQECEKGCVQPSLWEQQLADRQYEDECRKKDEASGITDDYYEYASQQHDTPEDLQDYDLPREDRYHHDPDELSEDNETEVVVLPSPPPVWVAGIGEGDDIPF